MFKQVCLQLIPDLMQWSEAKHIAWEDVLSSWIQSLFTTMSKPCVNRLWSILLFEGYGALLPLVVSLLMSNKQLILSLPDSTNVQSYAFPRLLPRSYLQHQLLPSISNIADIIRNFRVLISPNQPSSKFFDIVYIKQLRLQFRCCCHASLTHSSGFAEEVKTIDLDTKQKCAVLAGESALLDQSKTQMEAFGKEVTARMEDIRGGRVSCE